MSSIKNKKVAGDYLKIALAAGSAPQKDDLQILGLVLGIVCGSFGLTGILVVIGFLLINCVVTYIYSFQYLKVDSDQIQQSELLIEALMISLMNFIVSWVITYTFVFLKVQNPIA